MDRLQGQGSPILRRKQSYNNNNTQQIYHNIIGQRHAIITITTIFLAIVLIANNNVSNLQNSNRSEKTTNTILFDNSSGNNIIIKQSPLPLPSYSILPKKIYSVIGLESSGTQFVSKLLEDALHTGPYREGSRPCNETCNDGTPKCENMKHISEQHSCRESSDVLVQHFSLPWGGSCHFHPNPPIIDVVLPSQCTRDQVNQTEIEECNAMTKDIWGLELNGKPFQYPTRYQLDITANKKWYDEQGVEQYFIIVIRDAKISYLARHSHCNSAHLRNQEEEVGTQLIMEAINTFILQDVNEEVTNKTLYQWVASQYQEHRNGRMLSALPSRNNVVVVSYESLVKLGGTYVKMLYDTLGIDSDIIPDIRDSNEKYLNKTLQQDQYYQTKLHTHNNMKRNGIGWDFAVMGFPKCGTTFLLEVLKAHPEVEMGNRTLPSGAILEEFCQIHNKDGVEETLSWLQNTTSTASANSRTIKYGIKCPTMVRAMSAIENLIKMADHTRLVVGVRHPIKWFESFYNYRVLGTYNQNWNETIPKPHELVDGTKNWRDVSVPLGRFDIYLKQLAKTSLNKNELNEMLNHENLFPKNIMPNPYKVFIYTVEQLQDKNKTRQVQFQTDLQHHLGLETSFLDFDKVPKANVQDSTPYKEHIDICDSQYTAIRNKLLQQGRKSRDWIVNKFIMSSDVVVSDKDYFSSVLKEWGEDPCGSSSGDK